MVTDTALTVLKFAYLIVLWIFVLATIGLLRRDVFGVKKVKANVSKEASESTASPQIPLPGGVAAPKNLAADGVVSPSPPAVHDNRTPKAIRVIAGIAKGDYVNLLEIGDLYDISIGRSANSTIHLADSFSSASHARIFKHSDDWYIEDLHSTNGTLLNKQPVKGVQKLHIGEQIQIGKNILELEG